MGNQREMKEKIIKMLCEHINFFTLEETAIKFEAFVNQEVEKRIAERMPSELDTTRRIRNRKDFLRELGYPAQVLVKYGDAIIETIEWVCSRLTNPGDSQKTEGGKG